MRRARDAHVLAHGPPALRDAIAAKTARDSGLEVDAAQVTVSNVAQRAAPAAVAGPMTQVEAMRDTYDQRRRLVHDPFSSIDDVVCPMPGGAFCAFPDVRARPAAPVNGRTVSPSFELCNLQLDDVKVALVPGEGFGTPGHVLLSYALSDAELQKGLTRIVDVLQ